MPGIALFIPELGTPLLLTEDWDFTLHQEYRNMGFISALGYNDEQQKYIRYFSNDKEVDVSIRNPDIETSEWSFEYFHDNRVKESKKQIRLPAGSVLIVDRIYIRKGSEDFNSVTFNLIYCPVNSFSPKSGFAKMGGNRATIPLVRGTQRSIRFWVKLGDVNNKLKFDVNFKGDFKE